MPYRQKTKDEVKEDETRVHKLEAVLVQYGERTAKRLQQEWNLNARSFHRILEKAKSSILEQAQTSSSYLRAAMLRKVQIAQQKALDDGKYGAVAALVAREAELCSGLSDLDRLEVAAGELGPPPKDFTEVLSYCRKVMLINLPNILRDPTLSTKERTFLINDTCAKLGMTHDRARLERDIRTLLREQQESTVKERLDDVTEFANPKALRPSS